MLTNVQLDHLKMLEAEAIYVMREVAAEFERPIILYSVGKDSSVLLHLARKAFYPAKIPFPLIHVDTGFKFEEMYQFRDQMAEDLGAELFVEGNMEARSQGANPFDLGTAKCCSLLKTKALLDALSKHRVDAAIGGARRDEEKSRAKERFFSFRDKHGQWNPKRQRPELWSHYNTKIQPGESIRVFPLSNWTELDIWRYIASEQIPIVDLYLARPRMVVERGNQLIPIRNQREQIFEGEQPKEISCRFRSLGCVPCTGAIPSKATTVQDIIAEMTSATTSERSTRVIDHDREGSMEDKKREGYF